jgi:hypothetical protein
MSVEKTYKEFWQGVLKLLNSKTDLFKRLRSDNQTRHFIQATREGVIYRITVRVEGRPFAQVTVDFGNDEQRYRKSKEDKQQIEKAFGDSLEWLDKNKENGNAWLVRHQVHCGRLVDIDKEQWGDIQDELADKIVRLYDAYHCGK